jgi:hypothetical protein
MLSTDKILDIQETPEKEIREKMRYRGRNKNGYRKKNNKCHRCSCSWCLCSRFCSDTRIVKRSDLLWKGTKIFEDEDE